MTVPVITGLDQRGVGSVTLNRPEVGNAYNGAMIEGLLAAMDELGARPELRAVLLRGNGKHFQAGADLKWIREVSGASAEENERVSRATAMAVDRLNRLPVPTVALVQGGCFGGGTRMIAACDVVIAADNAVFSISRCAGAHRRRSSSAAQRCHLGAPAAPLCADGRAFRCGRGRSESVCAHGGAARWPRRRPARRC